MTRNPVRTMPAFKPITARTAPHLRQVGALAHDVPTAARSLTFSPDSALLAYTTYDSLCVWDVRRSALLAAPNLAAAALAFSPDGKTLAAAGRDVVFLDPRTARSISTLKGHAGGTTCLAYSSDGALLATGGMDGLVRVGSLVSRRLVHTFTHTAPVRALAISPDGETLAAAVWSDPREARPLWLWNLRTGRQIAALRGGAAHSLSFSAGGALLAADGVIYDAAAHRERWDSHDRAAAFSPDGSVVATCRSDFTTMGLWEAASGGNLALLRGHTAGVWSVAFSPDGHLLASGSGSAEVHVALYGERHEQQPDAGVRLWGAPLADPEATKPLSSPPATSRLRRLYD